MASILTALLCIYSVSASPLQFFYVSDTASTQVALTNDPFMNDFKHLGRVDGSCDVTTWAGTDPDGMSGYPSATLVRCNPGSSWSADGMVNAAGHLRFYLWYGSMTVQRQDGSTSTSKVPGSSFWVSGGTAVHAAFTGAFYVLGAPLVLVRAPPSLSTSSYAGLRSRYYDVEGAAIGHDPHINNGTGHVAKDIKFNSLTGVDPPNIVVLNCAPSVAPKKQSYVYYHSHPQGAVYVPFTGEICFSTDKTRCIKAGQMRWTSPNLFYPESFKPQPDDAFGKPNQAASQLVPFLRAAKITGGSPSECDRAVVFAVTNFDPQKTEGQPNFVDLPANAHSPNKSIKWGYWQSLTVRSTVYSSVTASVSVHPNADIDVNEQGRHGRDPVELLLGDKQGGIIVVHV